LLFFRWFHYGAGGDDWLPLCWAAEGEPPLSSRLHEVAQGQRHFRWPHASSVTAKTIEHTTLQYLILKMQFVSSCCWYTYHCVELPHTD
jgi:hypothetical protein